MYWLWKWLESYNNCAFSTWKNKFVFNLLFWIPDSFRTFHYYGRGGTPFLASPDGPSLIFLSFRFLNNFIALKNRVALKFSLCWNILSFRTFEELVLALKSSVPWIHCTEYIFLIIQNFGQLALVLKNRVCPEIFHCIEILFIYQDFWGTCACPENRVCHAAFTLFNILFTFRMFEQLLLALKNSVPRIHCIEYVFFIIQNFEQFALALKNRICPEIFHYIEILFIFQDF